MSMFAVYAVIFVGEPSSKLACSECGIVAAQSIRGLTDLRNERFVVLMCRARILLFLTRSVHSKPYMKARLPFKSLENGSFTPDVSRSC